MLLLWHLACSQLGVYMYTYLSSEMKIYQLALLSYFLSYSVKSNVLSLICILIPDGERVTLR